MSRIDATPNDGSRISPPLGAKVYIPKEKRPYTVQARNDRYAVCTKPFAALHTVLYFILDVVDGWRAPEDLIFGMGAETRKDCEEMLQRLVDEESGLSARRGVPWDVVRVVPAK